MDRREEVAALLAELAELTELEEQTPASFRVRAYENAVQAVRGLAGDLEHMTEAELAKVRGIGKGTARKVREYLSTGRIAKLEVLRARYPAPLVELSRVPGIGPKTLAMLHDRLGIASIEDLRLALEEHRVRELPGMGERSEEKLTRAVARIEAQGAERRVATADAMPVARQLVEALAALPDVQHASVCGSLRRLRETAKDIDLLVASDRPAAVMERFVALPQVRDVVVRGETKTSVVTYRGLAADLRVVAPSCLGAALVYFTGSKAHNIKLRQLALSKGWTLNEYALSDVKTGEVIASRTEEEVYRALGLPVIVPPMREDRGEVEMAAEGRLPAPLAEEQLRGDLHVHTTYSGDGRSPLAEVVAAAVARGYRYLAITDHGEDLPINGVDRAGLRRQREELRELAGRYPDITLLAGCELNIGPDGGLDYDPELRASLDWCVAAVHSHLDLPQARQTERIVRAMQDPSVNVIGHLSGRMLGRRPGMDLDVDAVLEAAVGTGTAIEINSALRRLDAAAEVLWRARERGVVFVVSTDAHHTRELDRTRWGVQQAQRGLLDPGMVANTWDADRFLAWARARRG